MKKEHMLAGRSVGQAREYIVTIVHSVDESLPLSDVMSESVSAGEGIHNIYVVDKEKRLSGAIRGRQLIEYLFPVTALSEHSRNSGIGWVPRVNVGTAADIMDKTPVSVRDTDSVADAARLLIREGLCELPVVDGQRHLIGLFSIRELVGAYIKDAL